MQNNSMGTIETSRSEGMHESEEELPSTGLLSPLPTNKNERAQEQKAKSSKKKCETYEEVPLKTPKNDGKIVLINKIPEIKFDFIEENANLAGKITDINQIAVFCRNVEADNKHIEHRLKSERELDP